MKLFNKNKPDPMAELMVKIGSNSIYFDEKSNMLYYQNLGRITCTYAELNDNKLIVDLGILDKWIYPKEDKKKSLTDEETELFISAARGFAAQKGYELKTENTLLSLSQTDRRYL